MAQYVGIAIAAVLVIFSISHCTQQWEACKAAGGIPVYEYKNFPSCWDAEGRRIFP